MAERLDPESLQEKESLNKNLGIEYVELEAERVVMTMPVDVRHHQPLGLQLHVLDPEVLVQTLLLLQGLRIQAFRHLTLPLVVPVI